MFKAYYQLTKPGIIYGNAMTAVAGYFLASFHNGGFRLHSFGGMLVGISLVIGSACVFNNYIDRGIDRKMARTKKRALVSGEINGQKALIFATVIGVIGLLALAFLTNAITTLIGAAGFIMYVVVYGWAKRHSVHGTIVGSLAGAVPPLVGYCAVRGHLDAGAVLVFLILVLWQMPHFYAIAMYRLVDYKAAGLPVLPAVKGMCRAKQEIIAYIAAFTVAASLPTFFGYARYAYLVVMVVLGASWLALGLRGFNATDEAVWARRMFFYSLLVVSVLSLMLAVGSLLP